MANQPVKNLLPRLSDRREYFDYLDHWTVGSVEGLRAHMTSRALVKAYLLETSRTDGARDPIAAIQSSNQRVEQLDPQFYRLRWPGDDGDWALMEAKDQRYPVLYTALESDLANHRVDQLISKTPMLDRAWFAAPMFERLWTLVVSAYPESRFSQMVFEYESVYESPIEDAEFLSADGNEDDDESEGHGRELAIEERRRARMQITERIGRLAKALREMRQEYEPLESVVRLRIPAPTRGGHDVYFDGRFTNRSDSIVSLRQTVETVASLYRQSTEWAEAEAWPQVTDDKAGAPRVSLGVPLLVQFSSELALTTFDRWITSLRRKNNRFRLWGNPLEMGPGKVHFYAVDNHLWQPIDLEITTTHLYAILSSGTCGNTIHRLVTNVQRFIDPKLKTYLGDRSYEDFITGAQLDSGRARRRA